MNANGIAGVPSNVINFSVFFNNPIGPPPALASPADGTTLALPVTLFMQPRNRLSVDILHAAVSGSFDENAIINRYNEVFRAETHVRLANLGRLAPAAFQFVPTSEQLTDAAHFSGKALKLAVRWASDDEWHASLLGTWRQLPS